MAVLCMKQPKASWSFFLIELHMSEEEWNGLLSRDRLREPRDRAVATLKLGKACWNSYPGPPRPTKKCSNLTDIKKNDLISNA